MAATPAKAGVPSRNLTWVPAFAGTTTPFAGTTMNPLRRGENQPRVRRDVLLQELHLVREDAAVGEDEVLGLVRHVRRIEKLEPAFLRQPIALVPVAMPAGADHVHPGVAPAARERRDVVAGEAEVAELTAAVGAHVAVAAEQLPVIQRRHLVEALGGERLALDGDDRVRGDAGALPGDAGDAAVVGEGLVAQRPGDQVLRIVEARLLPADPAVGDTVGVERKDERLVHWQSSCFRFGFCHAYLKKQRAARMSAQPFEVRNGWICELFIYGLLETLSGGESRYRLRGDPDLLAGRRTAARTRLALAREEGAEADYGDALALGDVFHDRIEHRVDRLPCRRLADIAGFCRNLDQVLFGYHMWHALSLYCQCTIHCHDPLRPLCGKRASEHRI